MSINISDPELELYRNFQTEFVALRGFSAKLYFIDAAFYDFASDPTAIVFQDPVACNITFEEYPNIKVLKQFGWYSEDEAQLPAIAYLPYYFQEPESFYIDKGNWAWGVAYAVGDMVQHTIDFNTAKYKCILAHTSTVLNPPDNTALWASLPVTTNMPVIRDMRIEVDYQFVGPSRPSRFFQVTEVRSSGIVTFGWVVKLAPVRDIIPMENLPTGETGPDVITNPNDVNYRYLNLSE